MKYKIIAFVIMAGVLSIWVRGYKFGAGNQVEQIPLIMRVLNPGYLSRDFMVNYDSGYTPRFFYSRIMAGLASVSGMPLAFLTTTVLSNIAVLAATALFASRLGNRSLSAVILAVVLVASFESIGIGGDTNLISGVLVPQLLALPLALWSVTLALRQRFNLAAFAAGVSGLIHPQVGLLVGGLALFTRAGIARSWLILFGFSLVWLPIVTAAGGQPLSEFLRDYVYWRNPHHYAPSTWPLGHYAAFALFLPAAFVAAPKPIRLLLVCLLLLFLCGYLFVEVWPVKLVIVLQLWRLAFLLKWIGLVSLGVLVAKKISWAWLILLIAGWPPQLREWALAVVLLAISGSFFLRRGWLLGVGLAVWVASQPRFRPQWQLSQLVGPEYDIARFMALDVNPGETVLAPINFSHLRFMVPVSIVVDWKSDPYSDAARVLWRKRILDIYGENIDLFAENYRQIDDAKIAKLSLRYDFSRAVLFAGTKTGLSVEYQNQSYKLVRVK